MLKQPTLDLKAKTINVQKWPKKIRTFVGITWVKIIVAIYFIPQNSRADSCGHFGVCGYFVALPGTEQWRFENNPSEEKIFKYGQK